MTSKFNVNDEVFVPFWVILELLDVSRTEPFIKCKILNISTCILNSNEGPVEVTKCDLELKLHLIATGLPIEYLIVADELPEWAAKIADWFLAYATKKQISS